MRHLLLMTTVSTLVLTTGGVVGAQEGVEAPPSGAFAPAGALATVRTGHTATLLPDGRVLITGGDGLDPEDLATAEIWDPASGTFGPAEKLAEPRPEPLVEADIGRTGNSATFLPDGRALVIGGTGTDGQLAIADAEILDPASGRLVPAGTLTEPRTGHTATFLRDGRVLVVGGTGPDGPLASAELWASVAKPAKCLGQRPTLFAQPGVELLGSKGNDIIAGSVGDDLIAGGGGNDRICGFGGDDTLDGGAGNDTIDGGPGADTITGAGGKDRLAGSGGDDNLDGGKGKDVCVGGKGIDWLPGCNEKRATRGAVVVTKNTKLKGPHKGRFIMDKNGVTLDCDGHTVTGAGRRINQAAVFLGRRKRVTVRNCDFRQHGSGVQLERSHRNRFIDNRVSDAHRGFWLEGSDGNMLTADRVTNVDDWFGYGLFNGSDKNVLRDNTASDVTGVGFIVWVSNSNTLDGNTANDGKGDGFGTNPGDQGGRAVNNTFTGNSSTGNTGWGFHDYTTGFSGDAGTDNHYADDACSGNGAGDSTPPTLCE